MDYDFEFATLAQLDVLFFNSFGARTCAPIVKYFAGDDDEYSDQELENLSESILAVYGSKWDRLKAVAKIEYDPIHNFKDEMHEEISGTDDITIKDTGTRSNTGTQKNDGEIDNSGYQSTTGQKLNTGTQETSGTLNRTLNDTIYGFNSSTSEGQNDHITAETTSGSREDDLAENTTGRREDHLKEEQSFKRTDDLLMTNNLQEETDDDYTRLRDYVRTGNVGNITYQKMLQEEIELWKWNFIQQVLSDVRDFTTLQIYS